MKGMDRREFIKKMAMGGAALSLPGLTYCGGQSQVAESLQMGPKSVVSVVQIKKDHIDYAVREAMDLIGGIRQVTTGKERVLLKPNLVSWNPSDVTKRPVIESLAKLMLEAGKDVSIGEGSAVGPSNIRPKNVGYVCRTRSVEELNGIQKYVFDALGYDELAKTLKIPLVNLHVGEMARIPLPDGFVFKELEIRRALADTDLLCSVPMMKTHGLAGVTLGMKNLIGVYPGQVYGTVRSAVHEEASKIEPSGTASAVVDMVRANKLGLTVVDASIAMQGQGPSVNQGGQLVKMDLIIAGTNPLATDMVAARIMGFAPEEISTFVWAWKAGLAPARLDEIEIRGARIEEVAQPFVRPTVVPYQMLGGYGPPC